MTGRELLLRQLEEIRLLGLDEDLEDEGVPGRLAEEMADDLSIPQELRFAWAFYVSEYVVEQGRAAGEALLSLADHDLLRAVQSKLTNFYYPVVDALSERHPAFGLSLHVDPSMDGESCILVVAEPYKRQVALRPVLIYRAFVEAHASFFPGAVAHRGRAWQWTKDTMTLWRPLEKLYVEMERGLQEITGAPGNGGKV